ncbi:MAG: hypothetical protein H3C47_12455 [Candidatus Cloacimonetes bacterium]|nr:hypothetical protein [Candidatus Cloacimonadota bacterium]
MSKAFEPFPPGWRKCVFRKLLRDRVKPALLAALADGSPQSHEEVKVFLNSVLDEVLSIEEEESWIYMQYKIFGIPNCDKMKKARNLLGQAQVSFLEINYKKNPPLKTWLKEVSQQIPLNELFNSRGMTFRNSGKNLAEMSEDEIFDFMVENPSSVSRPLLFKNGVYFLGLEKLSQSLGGSE